MDSNLQSSPSENGGTKAAFRKPSNDVANRKYRRRSPVGGSSSPDDGPNRERSSSPPRQDTDKVSDDRRRKDDGRDLDRHHGRSQFRRSGDSYRHSDRQSSRSSHNYPRQDDLIKHDKYADEDERSKSSSHSGRHTRRESDHDRPKDHSRNVSKYSRDKSEGLGYRNRDKDRETCSFEYKKYKDVEDGDGRDEKRDYRRSLGSCKGDRSPIYDEGRGHRNSSMQRDSEGEKSPAKKSKLFSNRDTEHGKDVSKFTNKAEEKQQSSSSKQGQDFLGKVTLEQDFVKDSDIDAAKVAAIKAAELVNRNLVGTGYMSTDQKKKLLWGNKKATTTEEPAHRWDASLSLFPDQERQEKFKKLMGVKGEVKVESSGLLQVEEKQKELQLDLEKQYTAGLRRRDGRTVGLGL